MSARCGVEVTVADTPADAVRRMDIVVTAGPIIKEPSPVIENEWFELGHLRPLWTSIPIGNRKS